MSLVPEPSEVEAVSQAFNDDDAAVAAPDGEVVHQRVSVDFYYPVHFTCGLFQPSNHCFVRTLAREEPSKRHRFLCVVDSGVAEAWPRLGEQIEQYSAAHSKHLELVALKTVQGGEGIKNDPDAVTSLQRELQRHRIDRHSFVVAIGGGAVLDAIGFAAATAHRGVRLVRVPTTVLAQDDSAVGVKNGVNAFGAKNFVGTFAPPFAVINDSDFLATLTDRDRSAGMAEAVKVALLRDPAFFGWLEDHAVALSARGTDALATLIRRSATIHMQHIAGGGDPFEQGSARPLDFGHWSAHRLESMSEHQLRHGEAVAIGIALDCRYAYESGFLSEEILNRVCRLFDGLGLRLWHPTLGEVNDLGQPAVLGGLEEFREHLGGTLTLTLLRGVGQVFEVHEVDHSLMARAVQWLARRAGAPCV